MQRYAHKDKQNCKNNVKTDENFIDIIYALHICSISF